MIPYEWVDRKGFAIFESWGVEANQLRQLKNLLIQLEKYDRNAAVGSIIFKTKAKGIYYSKINGSVALRPRCCIGPPLSMTEHDTLRAELRAEGSNTPAQATPIEVLTYLEQVKKVGDVEKPPLRNSDAQDRAEELVNGTGRRQRAMLHKEDVS